MGNQSFKPYIIFGSTLKKMREKNQESIEEVSEAVEIEPGLLTRIEAGETRPSEEILMLLMTHFDTSETEALKLWELGGYTRDTSDNVGIQTMVVMPFDSRIVYSDSASIAINENGVVLNFMQNSTTNSQPMAIARVGMSKKHAESVLELLQKNLNAQVEQLSQPRQLLSGKIPKTKSGKKTSQQSKDK